MARTSTLNLVHISVKGVVQGVGFRPFVYQLAARHNLKGWVCNTSGEVRIDIEGEEKGIEQFLLNLREQAPPQSHIEEVTTTQGSPARGCDHAGRQPHDR
jgi:hydrogenase maturation protein HypF